MNEKELTDIIPGWVSYKFTMGVMRPSVGIRRQFFQYKEPSAAISPYVGFIHTPLEKVLIWQPYALLASIGILIVAILIKVIL